ncbi:KIR protein [Plasmodium coatneyi]|uniref:KIR protein n=1 Tax=Plasmodium coatneyi TaxID=208452 RepID=A0A1B1DVD9_9APIC|nr:KIR protein [Plasmodium coatneyi]ANQ06704.1 KIR protein [Plasmodium coatneyi]
MFETANACRKYASMQNYGDKLASTLGKGIKRSGMDIRPVMSRIARGWCNAFKIQQDKEPLGGKPWDFFYYWLGTRVKQNWKEENFSEIIGTIYDSFPKDQKSMSICTDKYPGISESLFEKSKELFDFFYNYDTAKDELTRRGLLTYEGCNKSLKGAEEAYQSIKSACTGEIEHSTYCGKLTAEYGKYFDNGESKWACPQDSTRAEKPQEDVKIRKEEEEVEEEDEDLAEVQSKGQEDEEGEQGPVGGVVAPAAVSGALATIALPTLAYFFYKYKPFFFKKNNHSGVRRKKRSTLRHDLNTLSEDDEDDDTLTTAYSSEYSIPYTSSSR